MHTPSRSSGRLGRLLAAACVTLALPGAWAEVPADTGLSELQSQARAAANSISWAMASGHPLRLSVEQDGRILEAACYTGLASRPQALTFDDFGVLVDWLPIPNRMADLYLRASVAGAYQNPGASAFADEIGLCMDSTIQLQAAAARLTPVLFEQRPEWREDAVRQEGLAMFTSGMQQTLLGAMETAAAPGVPAGWRQARLDTLALATPDIAPLLPAELCRSLRDFAAARVPASEDAAESAQWQTARNAFECAIPADQ